MMKEEHRQIIHLISDRLERYPSERFGQALFNLCVNEFGKQVDGVWVLRDIYEDSDQQILDRMIHSGEGDR